MPALKNIIILLSSYIHFIPFSYGQGSPTTFDEIGNQLQISAHSAGEGRFNYLAFGVTEERVTIIKDWIKENGVRQKDKICLHENETAIGLTIFVCNGEMTYCRVGGCRRATPNLPQVIKKVDEDHRKEFLSYNYQKVKRISDSSSSKNSHGRYDIMEPHLKKYGLEMSPEGYEIITKIAENMSKHTNKKYMKIWLTLYNDDSESNGAINWHRDCLNSSEKNPAFLAFAVLDVTRPNDISAVPHSKIRLGLILEKYETRYDRSQTLMMLTKSPDYHPMAYVSPIPWANKYYLYTGPEDNCVKPLIELNNCTGSGYIVDQSMTRTDNTKIVHSRDARPYNVIRLSMILRCFCSDDENEMMKDPEYKEIKDTWDKNRYISVPSSGECKKRSASNLEELTIPSPGPGDQGTRGPGDHNKYKRSSSAPITIVGADI
ncbi:MAG: hypothetical protein QS748_02180 [Candidatus Endonucleobacter bathymodioli]|uniref:Uncharacterized protein n=1 Tax=Candidatus Endonucleibacter bathymodioli TaxID=539814 RepID=A0AA90SLQ5_9GAMM|nr:hypothetical protein [Candidatus Endonucleobacter bathymodioli]